MSTGTELELYTPVGGEGGLSGLDQRLLDIVAAAGGRISGEEIAEKLGVPSMSPARCLQRVKEILKSQDSLSAAEQKALLIVDLVRLRDMMFDRLEIGDTVVNRHGELVNTDASASMYSATVRMLREWRAVIESMQKDVDEDRSVIRRAHADVMIEAISVMCERLILRIEKEFDIQIPRELGAMLVEEVMPLAIEQVERKTAA